MSYTWSKTAYDTGKCAAPTSNKGGKIWAYKFWGPSHQFKPFMRQEGNQLEQGKSFLMEN